MKIILKSTFILVGLILGGCASSYKPIIIDRVLEEHQNIGDGIKLSYQNDILLASRNKKYAKKQDKRNTRVAVIEVTNQTDRPLEIERDIQIFSEEGPLQLLPTELIYQEIHQVAGLYMIWSVLWIVISKCENNDCSVIPLPVGVIIGAMNMGIARSANKFWKDDLRRYNLKGKTIQPGETLQGLIGFISDNPTNTLTARMKP